MSDHDNVEVLEGSAPSTGGIVVRKKKAKDDDNAPKASLLGLDKLAGKFVLVAYLLTVIANHHTFLEQKRRLKQALIEDLQRENENNGPESQGFQKPHSKIDKKALRVSDETPTYTGGVSEEAKKRLERRDNREKEKKFQITSKVNLYFITYNQFITIFVFSYSRRTIDGEKKVPNSNAQEIDGTIGVSEKTVNDLVDPTVIMELHDSETNRKPQKYMLKTLLHEPVGTMMI